MKAVVSDITSKAEIYFNRFYYCDKQLHSVVSGQLELIVVIPCYNEDALTGSLQSLLACRIPKDVVVEVIVVVNHGLTAVEAVKMKNYATSKEVLEFANQYNSEQLRFELIEAYDLPKKHAGVGLARKIGMDEALRRFAEINKDGVIVCFDADSLCERNYFTEIIRHFKNHPKTPGCSIRFEHPVSGNAYSKEIYKAIVGYELHLRYYKNALKYARFPFAYHTIGSSMVVRASAYAKQGGMNKRKAGEDFYFLNKIIELGGFTELSSTKVIPSPRISDRVPFGTGKAVGDIIEASKSTIETYAFSMFKQIKEFNDIVLNGSRNLKASSLHLLLDDLVKEGELSEKIQEIAVNTTSNDAFINRFYKVFDAFWVLKWVHFLRDTSYPNEPVLDASNKLLIELGEIDTELSTEEEALLKFREIDAR